MKYKGKSEVKPSYSDLTFDQLRVRIEVVSKVMKNELSNKKYFAKRAKARHEELMLLMDEFNKRS